MAEKLKTLVFEAWAEAVETAAGAAIYVAQERQQVLGVSAYLLTAFTTGNVMSAVWNIFLRASIA
jgi:hypothetical protein